MKFFYFITIISLCNISCDQTENNSNIIDPNKELVTTTIYVNQTIGGVNIDRPVIIQTPDIIDLNKNYPVVFAFHGRGGTNTNWVNKLKNFTSNGDFIGIYPQGYLKSWNLGSEPSSADDVEFVDLIIKELKNYNNLNFNKLYAIGTSNGSGMVNKLGIYTSHFKAIAPVVSQLMVSMPILENTKSISVFQINGAADSVIPINGGPGPGTHVFIDALKSAELWAQKFECSSSPDFSIIGNDSLYVFKNCSDDKEIRYLRIEKGQHNLYKQNPNLYIVIWEFFKRF
jgi:poly(3-hydroxybutyrate) depolymerase